ncbi:MAG: CHAT domain-containing protein [Pyrinomonadaceae bacterium]
MSKVIDAAPGKAEEAGADPTVSKSVDLKVTLVKGDITQVVTPVVVVGHYKGIAPIRAVGALDKAMDYWISEAGSRGMIGGDLGEIFFIPVFQNQIAARTILLGGMGDYGKFNYEALCYLVMNIAYGISDLEIEKFACVVIGSGDGGLDLDEAVKGLISGICDGLHHLERERRFLKELVLVELDDKRYEQILELLNNFADKKAFENLSLTISTDATGLMGAGRTAAPRRARPEAVKRPASSYFVNKITIENGVDSFEFTALTETAVVPVRSVSIQPYFTEGIADRLRKSEDNDRQKKFGSLLHTYVFPEDFKRILTVAPARKNEPLAENVYPYHPLTLILDSVTAALPWEMACMKGDNGEPVYFGRDLMLTRQFRTLLSPSPGIAPPVNKTLRFLVIADPAHDDPDLRLKGAEAEGNRVVAKLNEFKKKLEQTRGIEVEIVDRVAGDGKPRIDPIEILALLIDETFDVIHYSGHGVFDKEYPDLSGWVFGPDCILSAREIFRARQVPRLVFANACFTGVINNRRKTKGGRILKKRDLSAEETNKKLAGLAEAFFERGVHNYIGTGWAVDDTAALIFAEVFYEKAMSGELLGVALSAARRAIFEDETSSWGAYQHYGQSNTRLTLPVSSDK